jgi:tetratricopeptide (TPR) repeat protein
MSIGSSLRLLGALLLAGVALTAAPLNGESNFEAAVKAAGSGDLETAMAQFEAALSADPDNIKYGSEYRQVVIKAKAYDRCIGFFEKLVAQHPNAANAFLNYGFAYVDKIPDAGSITQVINANTALSFFTKSIELKPSWIGYYTRGNSYLYWPKIFNRTHLGIADLEAAMKIQQQEQVRGLHARAFVALGDGYLKMDDVEKAKKTWADGAAQFPDDAELKKRISASAEELATILSSTYDPNRRVDTNLKELWED